MRKLLAQPLGVDTQDVPVEDGKTLSDLGSLLPVHTVNTVCAYPGQGAQSP